MISNNLSVHPMQFMAKMGRSASEEIILSLDKSKSIPCSLHDLDACKTDGNFLDFTVRMTMFHTTSQSIILDCQNYFNFPDINAYLFTFIYVTFIP